MDNAFTDTYECSEKMVGPFMVVGTDGEMVCATLNLWSVTTLVEHMQDLYEKTALVADVYIYDAQHDDWRAYKFHIMIADLPFTKCEERWGARSDAIRKCVHALDFVLADTDLLVRLAAEGMAEYRENPQRVDVIPF